MSPRRPSLLLLLPLLACPPPARAEAAAGEAPGYEELTARAAALAAAGDWARAAAALDAGLVFYPQDFPLQLGRAYYLLRAGRFEPAAAGYRAALALAPESFEARLGLCDALLGAARWDAAESEAATLGARRPEDAALRNRHALALFWLGRLDEAEAEYAAALGLAPGDADALAGLGWVRQRRGDTPGARERFQQALGARPGHAAAAQGLAALGPAHRVGLWLHAGLQDANLPPAGNGTAAPRQYLVVAGTGALVADSVLLAGTYRHIGSLSPQPRTLPGQDELHLTAGWTRPAWGVAAHYAGVGTLSSAAALLPATVLGASARWERFVRLVGSAVRSSYADVAIWQLELAASRELASWLTLGAGARVQTGVGETFPSGHAQAVVRLGRVSASVGADYGEQLRPVDLETAAVYNVAPLRAWSTRAGLGIRLGGRATLAGSWEYEAYRARDASGNTANENAVQRFVLGTHFSL